MTTVRAVHPNPDVAKGIEYWEGIPATVDGVLGGYGNGTLPRIDALGSRTFLLRTLPYLSSIPPAGYNGTPLEWTANQIKQRGGPGRTVTRALDCGAGVGRVTQHSLLPLVDEVHLVEPVHKFLLEAKAMSPEWEPLRQTTETSPFKAHKAVYFHTSTLQAFPIADPLSVTSKLITPTAMGGGELNPLPCPVKYDVVWCQWCLQHLSEPDLIKFLKEARAALTEPSGNENFPGGVIVVKENVYHDGENGEEATWYDEEDYSVTRSRRLYERIFKTAGLQVVRTETQLGFPSELFDVQMCVFWSI
ncbi:protein N-terminal methyltransferase [Malassezia vespertilionis]|uniref:Alpha N-terminal protein methyltransferase 1 n=1 Tax=Malassezia vespertilionis TaxID=2020962 RepID=A0A2N1JC50_9BASI|nr:protein N-terminal methyltransferase [Malassezia vespertilionis]PKI84115.1 hypothetical protein MVES_001962 [Malassezia vespertilionis]WFD06721.1 protein N-terminal methyltransferase [Malassezia vespertilionis]